MCPGLTYLKSSINTETESVLLDHINEGEWGVSLSRRVQQFGPIYDYSTKKLVTKSYKEVPDWLAEICFPLLRQYFSEDPDQVIVNEYKPGQEIGRHIDAPFFGPTIASLSLMSDAQMLMGKYNGKEMPIMLERRSLLVLSGESRSDWYHCIPKVAEKRISITFRTTLE